VGGKLLNLLPIFYRFRVVIFGDNFNLHKLPEKTYVQACVCLGRLKSSRL